MRTLPAAASLLLALFAGTAAHAHAFLDHASPLVGGTVAAAPHEVTLWFTQSIEPAFSRVEVTDGNGARVDQGKAQVSGTTMRVGLKPVGAVCTVGTEGGRADNPRQPMTRHDPS